MSARYLTVRNVPEEISAALEREWSRRGGSLNSTIIELLRESLGLKEARSNGLHRLAGTWTESERRKFLRSARPFEEIDVGLWQQ